MAGAAAEAGAAAQAEAAAGAAAGAAAEEAAAGAAAGAAAEEAAAGAAARTAAGAAAAGAAGHKQYWVQFQLRANAAGKPDASQPPRCCTLALLPSEAEALASRDLAKIWRSRKGLRVRQQELRAGEALLSRCDQTLPWRWFVETALAGGSLGVLLLGCCLDPIFRCWAALCLLACLGLRWAGWEGLCWPGWEGLCRSGGENGPARLSGQPGISVSGPLGWLAMLARAGVMHGSGVVHDGVPAARRVPLPLTGSLPLAPSSCRAPKQRAQSCLCEGPCPIAPSMGPAAPCCLPTCCLAPVHCPLGKFARLCHPTVQVLPACLSGAAASSVGG
jgi:hypothetical protein